MGTGMECACECTWVQEWGVHVSTHGYRGRWDVHVKTYGYKGEMCVTAHGYKGCVCMCVYVSAHTWVQEWDA